MIQIKNKLHFLSVYTKAHLGNSNAMFELSGYYLYGIYVPESHQKAYNWLKKANALGLSDADATLHYCFRMKDGVLSLSEQFSDTFSVVRNLKLKAEQGDSNAMFLLGISKIEDNDVSDLQYKIGLRYIKSAAALNHPDALFILGIQYLFGKRIQRNTKKGFSLVNKATYLNSLSALDFLIKFYFDHNDLHKVLPLIEKAVSFEEYKNKEAIGILADSYMQGYIVTKNINKGIELYIRAAELGNADSQYNLALIYETGRFGIEKNINKAIYWYEKAVDQNDALATTNLGMILFHSAEEADQKKGFELLNKAYELGDKKALCNIGIAYKRGIGTVKDAQKAIEYYERAYQEGINDAAYNLYLLYSDGTALEPDNEKADYWKQIYDNLENQ